MNGVVDARQCGVIGDGLPAAGTLNSAGYHPDDAAFLNNCLSVAASNGYFIVSTGGGVILDNSQNIAVPANMGLTCGASAFDGASAFATGGNDYRIFKEGSATKLNLAKAIVLDPTNQNPTGAPLSINLTAKNTTLFGCIVEAGAGAFNTTTLAYPNPYSPSVFYPDCDASTYTGGTMGQQCTTLASPDETRASTAIQRAFSNPLYVALGPYQGVAAGSIGIVAQSGAKIRDVRVIGFGACIAASGPKPIVQNLDCDGGTGISILNSDVPMLENIGIGPDATTGEAGFQITAITWDTTHSLYRVQVNTIASGSPGFNYRFADGDLVWIDPQAARGAESTSGWWIATNTSCTASPCTFDLSSSMKSFQLKADTNAAGLPASVLSGIVPADTTTYPNLRYVEVGQTVTDITNPACTPISAVLTVAKVWPATGKIYLSGPLGCSSVAHDTFTFADHAYTGSAGTSCDTTLGGGCATVDPNFRWGDGIYAENSGGTRAVNCQVYEHQVSWHLYDGVRSAFFTNCATGNANNLPDRNLAALNSGSYPSGNIVSVLINGSHTDPNGESDACETDWANMVLGQHRTNNIVVQSDCDTPNRFANVSTGSSSGGIDMEVDAGGLSVANSEASGNHNIFKAQQVTLYDAGGGMHGPYPANITLGNNRLTGVTLTLENSAAGASSIGCGNVLAFPPPLNCPGQMAVAVTAKGVPAGTTVTLDASAEFWPCDASSGPVTLKVPQGGSLPNQTFRVKRIDASAYTCTISMGGSDMLDGQPSLPLTANEAVVFTNLNGTASWYITGKSN